MAEEFKAYLDIVDAQVRWKRARPAVLVGGYLFDYRWLGRHAWAMYGVGLIEWVLLAPMTLFSGRIMAGNVSVYLALLFPVLYAPVVYALRGRADGLALSLAALLPFAVLLHKDPFALAWMWFGAGAAAVLLTAIRFGLFLVKKRAAYACVCTALAFWIVYFYIVRYVRDHATWYLDPAQITEWSQAICEVPLLERTAVRSLLPFAGTGTAGVLWLGALALVVCGMLASLCARAFRLHNPLGRMLAAAAAVLFTVRGVGAGLYLLGIYPLYTPLPFVDGNLFSMVDAGILGLALSGLRQSACPETKLTDFSGSAKCRTAPAERT